MKLQTLTILFIIIILPIMLVVSRYIDIEVDTITKQTSYDVMLNNATYDAMKAFQLNESNSTTYNIPTEKIRDVEASVNTFYNSMSALMGQEGYSEEELKGYIPCLVYCLYDGYYIYTKNSDGNYMLKPYVYYTEEVNGYTVCYTLDNYIIVIGKDETGVTTTKSGYLYSENDEIDASERSEQLKENIFYNNIIKTNAEYVYKNFGNQSIKYYNINDTWYSLGTSGELFRETDYQRLADLSDDTNDHNVENYINESKDFTNWVNEKFSGTHLQIDASNNPDKYDSKFNEHRREIIKNSIKRNLEATLFNYNGGEDVGTFEFKMPELDETEWDKIINNVSLISFMQGLPLKNKYYLGYSVVTNTKSKEFVDPDEIYLTTENEDEGSQYHKITWKGFNEDNVEITGAYRNVDFEVKKYDAKNEDGDIETKYYYPHNEIACYESIVSSTNVYNSTQEALDYVSKEAKKYYFKALYRERYINYKSLNFGYSQ